MSGTARVTADGLLCFRGETLRCALGAGGISAAKREGDGATPTGLLPIRRILWRADRGPRPATSLPAEPIAPDDGWCDDPADAAYNTAIRLPHPARHERLWRDDAVYDVIGVLGWNDAPVQRGRGSAIFLQVAWPGLAPTEGCVALPKAELLRLLGAGMTGIEVIG